MMNLFKTKGSEIEPSDLHIARDIHSKQLDKAVDISHEIQQLIPIVRRFSSDIQSLAFLELKQRLFATQQNVTESAEALMEMESLVETVSLPSSPNDESSSSDMENDETIASPILQTSHCSSAAPLPIGVYGHTATTFNELIYVVGGQKPHALVTVNTVFRYDPEDDEWITVGYLRTARSDHTTVSCNGKLYAIGGYNVDDGVLSSVEMYDPLRDKWTFTTPMKFARRHAAVVSHEGIIYVYGGINERDRFVRHVERFDPSSCAWTVLEKVSTCDAVCMQRVVQSTDYMYFAGPIDNETHVLSFSDSQVSCEEYKRSKKASKHVGWYTMVMWHQRIYVLGGDKDEHVADGLSRYYDTVSRKWVDSAPLPQATSSAASCVLEGIIYLIGGTMSPKCVNRYNPAGDVWF